MPKQNDLTGQRFGRLIDADALDADLERQDMHTGEWDAVGFSIKEIENAPTIIPAEEEYTMEEFMYCQGGNPNDGSM